MFDFERAIFFFYLKEYLRSNKCYRGNFLASSSCFNRVLNISSIYSKIDNLQTPIVIQSFIASSNIFVKPIQTSSSLNKLSITKQLLTIDIIHPISHSYIPFVKSFLTKKNSFVSNIVKPIQTNSNIQQYPIYDNYSSSTPPMPTM